MVMHLCGSIWFRIAAALDTTAIKMQLSRLKIASADKNIKKKQQRWQPLTHYRIFIVANGSKQQLAESV
jgi:hypothetical protein